KIVSYRIEALAESCAKQPFELSSTATHRTGSGTRCGINHQRKSKRLWVRCSLGGTAVVDILLCSRVDLEDEMLSNSLIELDRAHLIHPVSSYRGHEALGVRVLKSAKGSTLTDALGHQLLDGFAGLWCVNVGYGQDSIVEAATKQLRGPPYATRYLRFGSE